MTPAASRIQPPPGAYLLDSFEAGKSTAAGGLPPAAALDLYHLLGPATGSAARRRA
jgi:hypothetical protein